jgi:hypothetical protein
MFVAQQKRKENIAEYILYMWQIEDLIRAFGLDMEAINAHIVEKSGYGDEEKRQLRDWYESLIEMMRLENVQQSGHIQIITNVLADVVDLHYALMKSPRHPEYGALFYHTLPTIAALKARENNPETEDIEVCFIFLYGVLLLRLQGKPVSGETLEAQQAVSKLLALLSHKYLQYTDDHLELD